MFVGGTKSAQNLLINSESTAHDARLILHSGQVQSQIKSPLSAAGTRTASQIWKIEVEVMMEEILRVIKIKLPNFALSPTLFRRRFRSLYVNAFDLLNSSKHDGVKNNTENIISENLNDEKSIIAFIVNRKGWSTEFAWITELMLGKLQITETDKAAILLTPREQTNVSNIRIQFEDQYCAQVAKLINNLYSAYKESLAIALFLNERRANKTIDTSVVSVIGAMSDLLYRVESRHENQSKGDALITRCYPVARAVVEKIVLTDIQPTNTFTVDEKSGIVSSVTAKTIWEDYEDILFTSLLQSLYNIEMATASCIINYCKLKSISAVLLFSFLYITQFKIESTVTTGEFVNWLSYTLEPQICLFKQDAMFVDGDDVIGFEKPPSFRDENVTVSVDDIILKHFFDTYHPNGLF